MTPSFDETIERRGTLCRKWDDLQPFYGVTDPAALGMWVADMDFRAPPCVRAALETTVAHGIYGYPGNNAPYLAAIRWWMANRHGWQITDADIMTVNGLVNGTAMAIEALTQPGDGIILMTPVYHNFARVIRAAGREVVGLPMALRDGRYELDWPAWEGMLTGRERMFILCSPHNPGGRVWSKAELRQIADFCRSHDLILVSDEIHHDLVLPGGPAHHVTATVAPDIADRLVTMTAATKTFNIAGAHLGNVIVTDPALRARYQARVQALGISPGLFGLPMVTAAYSPEGAAWVDQLTAYIDGNARLFNAAMNAIPGVQAMDLEATYLAWVDFGALGMTSDKLHQRIEGSALIAANHGETFGPGGENRMRFNLAMPRAQVAEAAERLQRAFADIQ
ncbi:pyridoxal phosphate-dependent aminotransferase [Paracoccus suum]|uniref:cysteine-S-conjugate beta-lyase n=1 Tax=Paracoccus suum TaxID=2259340 RepID=A0A344PGE0_9RHOB|nr:MalY/PatB family protein [Paracoccus suum]AXC48445.1 pyridoxal phosphate-dependent aminotransferase [Paracoccus suum]